MKHSPSYSLYGETVSKRLADFLHCEVVSKRSREHHWEIRPHVHPRFVQLLWLRKGSAKVQLGLESEPLLMPGIVLLPAGVEHAFSFSRDTDGIVVTLDQEHLAQWEIGKQLLHTLPQARAISLGSRHRLAGPIDAVVSGLIHEFERATAHREIMLRSQVEALCVLMLRLLGDSPLEPSGPINRKQRHLEQFRRMLDEHYREHLPLTAYAEKLGITSTQLNRVCKELIGLRAIDLVRERLLLEAERDLRFGGMDIKAIALLLGFSDPAYFSRFFKQHRGVTPLQFRERTLHG
jgi:AraC family transcriptional regulator, transcriptional activator of pobA